MNDVNDLLVRYEPFLRFKVGAWLRRAASVTTVEEDDLMQEARLAMTHAAGRFDAERGVTFLTFAGRWVDHCIRRWIQRYGHLVRGDREVWFRPMGYVRLDAPMAEGEEKTLHEVLVLEDADAADGVDEGSLEDRHVLLRRELERLSAREREVLLEHVQGRSLREVAEWWGVTKARAQQVHAGALKTLRRRLIRAGVN